MTFLGKLLAIRVRDECACACGGQGQPTVSLPLASSRYSLARTADVTQSPGKNSKKKKNNNK